MVSQTTSSSTVVKTNSSTSSISVHTESSSEISVPEVESPRTKAKTKAKKRWGTVLRWIPTSTDHIIAAEKRLLSLVKYVFFLAFRFWFFVPLHCRIVAHINTSFYQFGWFGIPILLALLFLSCPPFVYIVSLRFHKIPINFRCMFC